jgi:hypothetical protein
MIIIAKVNFPPNMSKEIGKCFIKLPAVPGYLTLSGPYVRASKNGGMQTITLYMCDKDHFSEALLFVNDRMTAYHAVPGVTYSCDPWLQAAEALKMVGIG